MNGSRISSVTILLGVIFLSLFVGSTVGYMQSSDGVEVGFEDRLIQDQLADVVQVDMRIPTDQNATLTVYGGGFYQSLNVTDRDGDGRTTLYINTYQVNHNGESGFSVSDNDTIEPISNETSTKLPIGRHLIGLRVDGELMDLSLFELSYGRLGDISYTASPKDLPQNSTLLIRQSSAVVDGIARGDTAVIQIEAGGVGGLANFTDPPGRNLVFSDPSTPSSNSTHIVNVPLSNDIDTISSVRVSYEQEPPSLTGTEVQRIGIDSNKDGIIDRQLTASTNQVSVSDSEFFITLAEPVINASDGRFYIELANVTNPNASGSHNISVQLGQVEISGVVEYGEAGNGVFGNGVSLDLRSSTGERTFASPMPYEYQYEPAQDRIYALLNTSSMRDSESLIASVQKPLVGVRHSEIRNQETSLSIPLHNRRATINITESRIWSDDPSDFIFVGNSTLAPGSEIRIRAATFNQPSPELRFAPTIVGPDQQFTAEVNLSDRMRDGSIEVAVFEDGKRISKSYVFSFNQ